MELRPYQNDCISAVIEDLKTHDKVGIVLPTGSGKTVIMNKIANDHVTKTDECVLILSHKVDLTTQTKKKYLDWFPYADVGVIQGSTNTNLSAPVVVGTMQTMVDVKNLRKWRMAHKKKVGLVIIDEAHRIQCDTYDKIFMELRHTKIIGFTATPYRSKQLMTNYFDTISYSATLEELINKGYLVPPKLFKIESSHTESQEKMASICHLYKDREDGKRAVVYLRTQQEAQEMAALFEHVGVKAVAITAQVSSKARQSVYEAFSKGITKVLTTVNVLTEGFDAPEIEVIMMPYPTQSPSMYLQRIGRGLRLSEGKTECRVYVCADAPSIKRGFFDKLHADVLKHNVHEDDKDTYLSDLANAEFDQTMSKELISWTETVCEAIETLKDYNCGNLAVMLNEKRLPDKFMKFLPKYMNQLKDVKREVDRTQVTPRQANFLKVHGFEEQQIKNMNKGEASTILSAISGLAAQHKSEDRFSTGKFKGRLIKDVPYKYKEILRDKLRRSTPGTELANYEKKMREGQLKRRKENHDHA